MKRFLISHTLIAGLFVALSTLIFHNISSAQTHIHVDAVNGVNAPTGRGAAGKAYKSITFAFLISERNNLPDPWHVHIHPGTYNADPAKPPSEREVFPIRLRSKMLFQGTTTAAECIIDGQHVGKTETSILHGEDVGDLTIRNLTLQNMDGSAGIFLWDTGGPSETTNSIETCIIHNISRKGVETNITLVLIGNTFSNNSEAVFTRTNCPVLGNTFSNNGNALKVDAPYRGFLVFNISDNIFENNRNIGVYIDKYTTLTGDVTRNKFINSPFSGWDLIGTISHNTFTDSRNTLNSMIGDFTHNTFTQGNGFTVHAQMTGNVTHNTFNWSHNAVSLGRGFTGSITHNLFDSNGNISHLGNAEFTNNIFIDNATVHTAGPTIFTNNLFMVSDGLSATALIPAVSVNNGECRFHNNIFSGMKEAIFIDGTFDLPITHNLFHNIGTNFVSQDGVGVGNDLVFWELLADGASDNITGGLLLKDPANRDFHPVAGSPTINAGTNKYASADDFDGVARPIGDTVDIGPYEYNQIVNQTQTAGFVPEDVNQDGRVSIADVVEVAQNLGKPVSEKPRADVNGDGKISFADLVAIARAIAKARSDAATAPGHEAVVLDAATVRTWLELARVEDDGSLMFREGTANLERLLASLLPKETVLLANYPNPFNPETWIPYLLAKSAEVSIAIHTGDGQLVRVLALGTQSAGSYQSRSRAAYWDGRNAIGERVASGLYYYTLIAGDFVGTRKLLILK